MAQGFSDMRTAKTLIRLNGCAWLIKCGPREGDRGSGPPPPPGKSQVIWVSIGNKQLDPPPLEKVGPPPPPGKCWTPSETLKMIDFFELLMSSVK